MPKKNATPFRMGGLPGIRRLPLYVNLLRALAGRGQGIISATQLAEAAGLVTAVVKKDIEMTGATGKTGVGYGVEALIASMEDFLGWNLRTRAVLAGAGSLGSALLGYGGLREHGLEFIAAFDSDPEKVGRTIHGVEVLALGRAEAFLRRHKISTGVLTVPAAAAQSVADAWVRSGVTRIWSFAPVVLEVPEGVTVQREDLSAGLAELMVRSRFGEK